jgi:methylenetetrahydrofolate reductase (NADH)
VADDADAGVTGLRAAIESGGFVTTAEVAVPHGVDPARIARRTVVLRGWVDAANVTDNPSATVMLSSLAGSRLVQDAGVEAVMQLTCRDRNRIALQSDLLGAAALGIANVLLLTGDHPRFGDHPEAKPVFDLDSVQLLGVARSLRDTGRLLSGREVDPVPAWLIGAVENPFAPPQRFRALRLAKKADAGAQFVQTQFVFDVPGFARWMREVCDLGVDRRCAVLAGVGPIRSPRALEFLRHRVPGVYVPDDLYRRLRAVPGDRFAAEAMQVCVETVQQVRDVAGVRGVHVMPFGREQDVPEILERAGIGARTAHEPRALSAVTVTGGGQRNAG